MKGSEPKEWSQARSTGCAGAVSIRFSVSALIPGLAQERSRWKSYHIASGNQNFYGVQVAQQWSAEQIQQQIKLIEDLMAQPPNGVR